MADWGRTGLPTAVQLVLAALTTLVFVLALVIVPSQARRMATRPEPPAPAPTPGAFQLTPEQWRTVSFGTVEPVAFADVVNAQGKVAQDDNVTVQVTPPFSGRVTQVLVKAGDRVARGQPLLYAEASEVAQARNDLTAAQAALATAHAQALTAQANAVRQRALLQIDGAAAKDVQQAQSDAVAAVGTERSDQAAADLARSRLKLLQEGAGSGAQASLKAPISGVVLSRAVAPGQYLNATSNGATTPILVVSDTSRVWLSAGVREEDASKVHVGQDVRMQVAGLPGRSFEGRLDYVASALDPATRRLEVRASVANPGGLLKPETFADAAIAVGPAAQALAVPAAAVIYEGDDARVWVAGVGRTVALRQIRAGRTVAGEVEVLSGLNAGDRVATAGALFIDRAARAD